jgi:hypothetical protein
MVSIYVLLVDGSRGPLQMISGASSLEIKMQTAATVEGISLICNPTNCSANFMA